MQDDEARQRVVLVVADVNYERYTFCLPFSRLLLWRGFTSNRASVLTYRPRRTRATIEAHPFLPDDSQFGSINKTSPKN